MPGSDLQGVTGVFITLELPNQAMAVFTEEHATDGRQFRILGQEGRRHLNEPWAQVVSASMIMTTSLLSEVGSTVASAWLSAPAFLYTLSTLSITSYPSCKAISMVRSVQLSATTITRSGARVCCRKGADGYHDGDHERDHEVSVHDGRIFASERDCGDLGKPMDSRRYGNLLTFVGQGHSFAQLIPLLHSMPT